MFRGTPLNEVLVEINRYFKKKIRLVSPELGEKEVVAVIYIDSFERVVETLEKSLSLKKVPSSNKSEIVLSE